MSELKQCPFCGGELAVNMDEDGWWHHSCVDYCYLSAGFPTKQEAIVAANTRAGRTCHAIRSRKYGTPLDGIYQFDDCSDCGCPLRKVEPFVKLRELPNYCPSCGAKVVNK